LNKKISPRCREIFRSENGGGGGGGAVAAAAAAAGDF